MRNKLCFVIGLVLTVLASCSSDPAEDAPYAAPRRDSIELSEVSVNLPEGPGKSDIERSCVPCHSLRYIEMQPLMPRKSWEKTVTKMIKNFGALVKDSIVAARIVDYLVTIKGKK